jgi:hypothetical protein
MEVGWARTLKPLIFSSPSSVKGPLAAASNASLVATTFTAEPGQTYYFAIEFDRDWVGDFMKFRRRKLSCIASHEGTPTVRIPA